MAHRASILACTAEDNPSAAIALNLAFEGQEQSVRQGPMQYKPGRVNGTSTIAVRPNYVMVHRFTGGLHEILRVLHAAQQGP